MFVLSMHVAYSFPEIYLKKRFVVLGLSVFFILEHLVYMQC